MLKLDFNFLKVVFFEVRWYILLLQGVDITIIDHDNGFTMINTTRHELSTHQYVLSSQCEKVFYILVPSGIGWSFSVRYDTRGRPIKYVHEDIIEN